jgi:hypothetical protein
LVFICGRLQEEHGVARICFVLVAGLDRALLERVAGLPVLGKFANRAPYQPVLPAVTCTAQATLSTGATAGEHGIICNGLYTHGRRALHPHLDLSNHAETRVDVSFWEQSNTLLERPRFWAGSGKKVAMLFWQNSMRGAADIVLTPKPEHTPDGKTLTACWGSPGDLYAELVKEFGPFPLHKYWSPMAGLESSQWIAKSAVRVWEKHQPDLQLVYIPQLDYNLMRQGPSSAAVAKDLQDVDALLAPLAEKVRADGGIFIVAGDYGMSDVKRGVTPNLALRQAGLLKTKADANGKLVIDYDASDAFAMVDHQIAHVYVKPDRENETANVLGKLDGVGKLLTTKNEIAVAGLANERTGNLVLLASPDAWLVHDWWLSDAEKPAWQFGVDIHSKPGFDTRELFFDPARKCIAQDAGLVKGSHGLVDDASRWPMLLSDAKLPAAPEDPDGGIRATSIAGWLRRLLTS